MPKSAESDETRVSLPSTLSHIKLTNQNTAFYPFHPIFRGPLSPDRAPLPKEIEGFVCNWTACRENAPPAYLPGFPRPTLRPLGPHATSLHLQCERIDALSVTPIWSKEKYHFYQV